MGDAENHILPEKKSQAETSMGTSSGWKTLDYNQ